MGVFLGAQKGRWIELANVRVGNNPIDPSIEGIALLKYFWRDRRFPDVFRDIAAGIECHMGRPHAGGTEKVVPVDTRSPGNDPVKVVRVMMRGGVDGCDLLPNLCCDVYRAVRKVNEGFTNRLEESGGVEVPVVTIVRPDRCKVEIGSGAIEVWIIHA